MHRQHTFKPWVIGFSYLAVTIGANLLAVIGNTILMSYGLFLSPEEHVQFMRAVDLSLDYEAAMQILSFGIPTLLVMLYIRPIHRALRSGLITDPRARRHVLNAPLVISICSLVGWIIAIVEIVILHGLILQSEGNLLSIMGKNIVIAFLTGVFCFVLTFYSLELMARRWLVPRFFPDNKLTEVPGVIRLSIRARLFIFWLAIMVFPSAIWITITLSLLPRAGANELVPVAINLGLILLFLGSLITHLLAGTWQKPLIEMKQATDNIRAGDYNITVGVRSVDEAGHLGEGINEMAGGLREKEFIKDTLGRIVDPAIRDHLLRGKITLGGEIRDAVILFSDIRNFTGLSETMRPEDIVNLLNSYFSRMAACVTRARGVVNKYLGDGMMALFGVPSAIENAADRALLCATEMHEELTLLNTEREALKLPPLSIGIGLHAGEVLAGNIGSAERLEFTVIGDAVNAASRMEGLTKEFGARIVFSEEILRRLDTPEKFSRRFLGRAHVKGRAEPLAVFELLDAAWPADIRAARLAAAPHIERAIIAIANGDAPDALRRLDEAERCSPKDPAIRRILEELPELRNINSGDNRP